MNILTENPIKSYDSLFTLTNHGNLIEPYSTLMKPTLFYCRWKVNNILNSDWLENLIGPERPQRIFCRKSSEGMQRAPLKIPLDQRR